MPRMRNALTIFGALARCGTAVRQVSIYPCGFCDRETLAQICAINHHGTQQLRERKIAADSGEPENGDV